MSAPTSSNPLSFNGRQLADRDHHGWLAWLPWWLPAWVPVVTIGGVVAIAAGMGLVFADLIPH